ncbi:uncharacterized protein LOC130593300 [Pezoporus wallicus]|uniref:uncharacterized protein LOC130593300 n=1 Tax=Pezoporus wallicus TaxID=35540 RepID=UPI00254E7E9C|nr:uncharacterized protein LOC130593300 [Pezoporus wallicus]
MGRCWMRRGEGRSGAGRGGAGLDWTGAVVVVSVVAVIRLSRDGAAGGTRPYGERADLGKEVQQMREAISETVELVAVCLCLAFSRQLVWDSCPSALPQPGNTPASEGGQTGLQASFLCPQGAKGSSKSAGRCPCEESQQQQQGQTCSWAHSGSQEEVPPLSGGPGDQLRRASTLQLQCCRHRAEKKGAGASLFVLLLALEAPRIAGQRSDKVRFPDDCRNAPDLWKGQAEEMQQLRDEVTRLAAEIRSINKEVQQMREAISEPVEVPDWALKSTGTAIDLQRSSSTSAWLRRMFWSLFSQPFEDTFVQPDASPGYCWPMQQTQSEVLIRLPTEIQPTAITLQCCSEIATPLVTVSSAPKNFTVSVSLCWARGWDLTTGKAVTRTCCSLRICRDVCAPKHCPS